MKLLIYLYLGASPIFFVSFIVIGLYIVQNLFVLVLIGALNQENTETASDIFDNLIEPFTKHYLKTLKECRQREFTTSLVLSFFRNLNEPLGKYSKKSLFFIYFFAISMK